MTPSDNNIFYSTNEAPHHHKGVKCRPKESFPFCTSFFEDFNCLFPLPTLYNYDQNKTRKERKDFILSVVHSFLLHHYHEILYASLHSLVQSNNINLRLIISLEMFMQISLILCVRALISSFISLVYATIWTEILFFPIDRFHSGS